MKATYELEAELEALRKRVKEVERDLEERKAAEYWLKFYLI